MKARESVGYAAVAVLHVDDGKVVPGEAGNLSEGGGETEEENPVKGLAIPEAGFQGLRGDGFYGDRGGGGGRGLKQRNAFGIGAQGCEG